MDSIARVAGPIHLGLDVSKNKIAVGILRWGEQVPDTEMLVNDEASVRRLVNRFDDSRQLGSATRRDRPGSGCIGCCARWVWPAT
jgi:hypothetical protein